METKAYKSAPRVSIWVQADTCHGGNRRVSGMVPPARVAHQALAEPMSVQPLEVLYVRLIDEVHSSRTHMGPRGLRTWATILRGTNDCLFQETGRWDEVDRCGKHRSHKVVIVRFMSFPTALFLAKNVQHVAGTVIAVAFLALTGFKL